ncbi:MAG: hypothetical protein WCT50_04045 [Patescibacteria group bacterium]
MSWKKQNLEDLELRKKSLKSKLVFLIKESGNHESRYFRCRGYLREILINYDQKKFFFAPDTFIIDKDNILSIVIGVSRSPIPIEGDVLWIFSEDQKEIHYISSLIPKVVQKDYVFLAS